MCTSCKVFLYYLQSVHFYVHVNNLQQKSEAFGHSDESILFAIAKAL